MNTQQNIISKPSYRGRNHEELSNFNPSSCSPCSVEQYYAYKGEPTKKVEGVWSDEECIKFVVFIHLHHEIFNSKTRRKFEKIFKKLASYLGTRTPRQCRSRFQKLNNRFGSLIKIRNNCKEDYGVSTYERYYEQMSK